MNKRYMLDTNAINHALRQHPTFMANLQAVPMAALCISAVTYAEITYGLAKKPEATKLHKAIDELLKRLEVLPFDKHTAQQYGQFKATIIESTGKSLVPLDMMIAAHAHSIGAVLISQDQAFHKIVGLHVQDWTKEKHLCRATS